jgi:sirohydrochlorin cobaltochelatase
MTEPVTAEALLLFAHGSSDPGWAEPFRRLEADIRRRAPDRIVELAFLERMIPSFDEAVSLLQAKGVTRITVAPLFLALGGHLRKDLPALVSDAQRRTGIEFNVLPALGQADSLIDAMATWVLGELH